MDKSTNDIYRSRNGEAKVLNLRKRFNFEDRSDCVLAAGCQEPWLFIYLFFLKICQEITNLNKRIQLLYVYLRI